MGLFTSASKAWHGIKGWIHDQVMWLLIGQSIIYNMSWEDPRIDHELFKFNSDDVIVTLTSAGDQVLDYLLASPKKVISVDLNERQNALLELKLASIRELSYEEFFAIFASSDGDVFKANYQSKLRKHLAPKSKAFWDANQTIFDNYFFWSGACGNLVRYGMLVMRYVFGLNGLLDELEHCESLEKQRQIVEQYRGRLENVYWFLHQTSRLWAPFIAVPASQLDLYEGNIMKEALDSILSKTHLATDNYFFFGQFYGYWTKECCPRYLKEGNYAILQRNVDHVEVHHATLAEVITKCPDQSLTCMSLLDHMDWMSDEIILDCFKDYVKKLAPGARIFWRSFSDFQHIAPLQYLHFHQKDVERVIEENPDRVMMYKKTFFATVPAEFDVLPRQKYEPQATMMQDLSVLFNMYVKPISGDDHKARLNSFYENQKDNYDVFRHRFLHGRWPMACAMPSPKDAVWVDIGGGTGSNLEFFGKEGIKNFGQVYILDLCEPLLQVAEKRVTANGWEDKVKCILGDACDQSQDGAEGKLPAAGTVDVVTFSYSLTMIPDWKAALDHAYALLKPGGVIAIGDFTVTKQHSYFTRTLWPAIFSLDGIKLSTEHIPQLDTMFKKLACKVRRGGFPYLNWIPFAQCPYYHYVGQKPGGNGFGPNGDTDKVPALDVE